MLLLVLTGLDSPVIGLSFALGLVSYQSHVVYDLAVMARAAGMRPVLPEMARSVVKRIVSLEL